MKLLTLLFLYVLALTQGQTAFISQSADIFSSRQREARGVEGINWNEVVDRVVKQFREQNKNEISIPNFHKMASWKYFVKMPLTASVEGSKGYLRSIHSLHRLGNVTLSEGDVPTLTAFLRFGSLRIRYEDFQWRLLKYGPHGRLDATVPQNSVRVRVRVRQDGDDCRLEFEDVEMVEMGKIDVKLTGLGPLNRIASFIATKIVKLLRESISSSLERLFAAQLRMMFKNAILSCKL